MLETGWQKVVALGIAASFLAVIAVADVILVVALTTEQVDNVGNWLEPKTPAIVGFLIGAIPAAGTYLLGKKSGGQEAYNSAIATVLAQTSGGDAAALLTQEAEGHGLNVKVR